jgi:hypothetical protein
MFFDENINLKTCFYFRRCGVIPVPSFGSHIRPQPSGLGLTAISSAQLFIFRVNVVQPFSVFLDVYNYKIAAKFL